MKSFEDVNIVAGELFCSGGKRVCVRRGGGGGEWGSGVGSSSYGQ